MLDRKPPRTVLEAEIRQRRMTLDEFTAYAEQFARDHNEPGTLSRRHLDRLVSGGTPTQPLGHPQPTTARLLERIFGVPVDRLLSQPTARHDPCSAADELSNRLAVSRRIDRPLLDQLSTQLAGLRALDRQLGAIAAHDEVLARLVQANNLRRHTTTQGQRTRLAELCAELGTLAGWQSLDAGRFSQSWCHYADARTAAHESENPAFTAHTSAEQAFVLLDIGETAEAVNLLRSVRAAARRKLSPLLRSWLAAAHGEALAAHGDRSACLRAFDTAARLLPTETAPGDGPYVVLDITHLGRWRGHALARVGDPAAVSVLTDALDHLEPSFTRAAAALRVDLASAHVARREADQASTHLALAADTAESIGSNRQRRRIRRVRQQLGATD